jgi:hypothetical protein
LGHHHWFVAAQGNGPHRTGICLDLAVYNNRWRGAGSSETIECAAPAVKRGMLLVQELTPRRSAQPQITAVGGAFNRAVDEVEVAYSDGSTETLRPHPLHSPHPGAGNAADLRYLTFAVRGEWKATSLTTYSSTGELLWEAAPRKIAGETIYSTR